MALPTSDELRFRAALAFITGMAKVDGKPKNVDQRILTQIGEVAQRVLDGGEVYPMGKVS